MSDQLPAVLAHYGLELSRDHGSFTVNAICHDDAHRSASVNLDYGLYNCFTCSWGGDAYTVIMHQEGVSFDEAKRILEGITGESGGKVRDRPGFEQDGYGLPRRAGDQRKRGRYIPAWKRG